MVRRSLGGVEALAPISWRAAAGAIALILLPSILALPPLLRLRTSIGRLPSSLARHLLTLGGGMMRFVTLKIQSLLRALGVSLLLPAARRAHLAALFLLSLLQ
ncbi:hypothetical protein T484DRAFT_1768798, partial [Baffinella frigidus]